MKRRNIFRTLAFYLFFAVNISWCHADILFLISKQEYRGQLSYIGNDFVEFVHEKMPGEKEWLKVAKKDLLAIVSEKGKIVYPRDKYDENALNSGRISLRNQKESDTFEQRKIQNIQNQLLHEKKEKGRYKVAALVGGLSGLMLYVLIDSR